MNRELGETDQLVQRAVAGDEAAVGPLLERHRAYLKVIARRTLDSRVGARVDASDVVQQTMLSAFGQIERFHGETAGDFVAWLRVIHERNLHDVLRAHLGAEKRAVGREVSGGETSGDRRLETSPTASQRLMADEDAVRLARELDALPEHQQEAVRLRYLEGWPVAEIAAHLERSGEATAGLLKRGVRTLRERLQRPEE